MLSKHHIEKILKLNGVQPDSSDGEIKSVLLRARWKEDDVETALVVLRENKDTQEKKLDTLHRVFRSDDHLEPEMVSALLGVDVTENLQKYQLEHTKSKDVPVATSVIIIGTSLALALASIAFSMWVWEIGPFHAMY